MESLSDLDKLKNYRLALFNKYKKDIITDISSVGYGSFYFIKQNKIKYITKAQDVDEIVLNYLFWTSLIERNTVGEKLLVMDDPEFEDLDTFHKNIENYVNKRDRMVKRLIINNLIKIEQIQEVKSGLIEIIFEGFEFPFYIDKINLGTFPFDIPVKRSNYNHYIPFIYYQANF